MTPSIDKYFASVTASVFDSYFRQLGASRVLTDSQTSVRYSTDKWFAEVLYLPPDGPKYLPRVVVGCLPEQFVDPRRNRVDVMHTAPQDSEEHHYNLRWRYQTADELRDALEAVKRKIFDVHAIPYLQDPKLLKSLLEHRNATLETEWMHQVDDHNDSVWRTRAKAAFKSKDFKTAIECYNNIPHERLTKAEKLRLNYMSN